VGTKKNKKIEILMKNTRYELSGPNKNWTEKKKT